MTKSIIKLLLFIVGTIALQLNAQNTKLDSLETQIREYSTKDTNRVNLLIETAYKLTLTNRDKCLSYAKEAGEIADKQNYAKGKAESYRLIGICFHFKSDYTNALEYYQKSLKINEEIRNKKGISGCLNNIGSIYKTQGNHAKALEYYQKSLVIYNELDYKSGISATLNNLGIIYRKEGNYSRALESYQKALKIYEEDKNKQGIAMSLNNISVVHKYQKNYLLSLEYNLKSLKIKEEIGDKQGISASLFNIGSSYFYLGNYSKSMDYTQKSLKIKEEIGDKKGLYKCLSNMGEVYYKQGNYNKALEYFQKAIKNYEDIGYESGLSYTCIKLCDVYITTKDFSKALNCANKSLEIAKRLNLLDEQKLIHEQLSFIYANTKNYKKAYENHLLYKEFNDSVFNEGNIKKITGLEYQYEFEKEKQALELEQQTKDIIRIEAEKRQKIVRNSFIAGFILMSLFVLLVFRSFLQKRKANLILAKQKGEIQKQAEELQITNEKLIKLDEFKEGMTGMIVHDLKNPLNGIINVSKSFSMEKQNSRMKLIGQQILNMVVNILDVYKYEDSKMIVDKLDYSLLKISQDALQKVDFLAEQKSLTLENNILPETGIKGDKEIIERIFVNILTNAIKYSPENGSIKLKSISDKKGLIKVSISDTGQGIPPNQLKKVFDKFGQVSPTKSGTVRSTGLGLTFCKIAVEAHGGEIEVESEINKGTTFWFTLQTTENEFQKTGQVQLTSFSTTSNVLLTAEDMKYLELFVLQFKKHKIYDISILRNILKQIDAKKNERISCWKENISQAIRIGNEEKFRELLNEAFID